MSNPVSQPKIVYKIHFITNYKFIESFEEFFPEDIPGIITYEVESKTIDSEDDDLWSFEAYLTERFNFEELKSNLILYASKANLLVNSDVTYEEIEDKDWVTEYQKQLKPITIGRFIVTSTAQNLDSYDGKTPIFIEASRAFGTGDHATTSLCINAMENLEKENVQTVFDVGTGSGILSFAAEKIWPSSDILACDIEEISVQVAKENLIHNNSKINFYQNTETDLKIPPVYKDNKFDIIVSNILAKPLILLAPEFKRLSINGTKLILSGFLDYQKDEVANAYQAAGFKLKNTAQLDEWIALTFYY